MNRANLTVVLFVAVSGCGTSVTATRLASPPHALTPRSAWSVKVFASGPPQEPHVDVALLEVEQAHGLNEQGTHVMITELRRKAGEMGCDGVAIGGMRETDGAQPGSGWDLIDPGSTTLHATCIVYTDEPDRPRPVARRSRPRPAPPPPAAATAAPVHWDEDPWREDAESAE
jgi:hypothetical protein